MTTIGEMQEAVKQRPMSAQQLAKYLGESYHNVGSLLSYHRKKFRVHSWTSIGERRSRIWANADGTPDVPRPGPIPVDERTAGYRKIHRKISAAKASKRLPSPWAAFL